VSPAGLPDLRSSAFLVKDLATGAVLLEKYADSIVPIASITKLMTAMVVLDAHLSPSEELTVTREDIDTLRGSRSRRPVGSVLRRDELLHLALMASENRAASALARSFPGGRAAFIAAMNRKAATMGLRDTHFFDSTGLNAGNVSSAQDLAVMVEAAAQYPLIREFSTSTDHDVVLRGRTRRFGNTNALVKSPDWDIGVSKTGYINESGRCLVMQARLQNKPLIIVLLDSFGKYTRVADAKRVRKWLESHAAQHVAARVADDAS
jgi:D-alanyl-D-alanine endopeptidase (penicillin-binding protein 7)